MTNCFARRSKPGRRAVVWAHKGEVEEVQTNEEGCVLNLNDPETMNKAIRPAD